MEYIGEHILIGTIGQAFISIAFSAAILAAYSFYKSSINESLKSEWLPLARGSFYIHGISVLGIIVCMFIMIYNHYFEYQYVWQHSSKSLPTRYMISCFWEGQEGSFLLWIFWNILLGLILIRIAKRTNAHIILMDSAWMLSPNYLCIISFNIFIFEFIILDYFYFIQGYSNFFYSLF